MVEIKNKELDKLRIEIDKVDNELLKVMERRFELVDLVSQCKKKNHLPIRDMSREDEVIKSKFERTNLSEDFVKKLYRLLIDEAVRMQEERKW